MRRSKSAEVKGVAKASPAATLMVFVFAWIVMGSNRAGAQWWTEEERPGEAEKRLQPFVGSYEATMTLWSGPDAEPVMVKGTSMQELILDGWILQVRDEYPALSLSFIGYHFYDPTKAKYVNVGMSNKAGWLAGEMVGQFNDQATILTYHETIVDTATGEKVTRKGVARLADNGYTYENLRATSGRREWRSRLIVYQRR